MFTRIHWQTYSSNKMDPARRKALGRSNPKQGKLKRVKRTTSLLRRQSESVCRSDPQFSSWVLITEDKTWLETHIWHAKRMHMDIMWGYKLVRLTHIVGVHLTQRVAGCNSNGEILQAISQGICTRVDPS